MHGFARSARTVPLLLVLVGMGCGKITVPVVFGLVGGNTISLEVPLFAPPNNVFGTTLVGGASATVQVDLSLFTLLQALSPQGIAASISIDQIRIAGPAIDIFGLSTGTLCIFDDPSNPSGGFAYDHVLNNTAEFHLTLNTLISPTDPFILTLFPDPLPFAATIDQTVPVTLPELLGLLAGKTADIEISQEIQSTLPDDLPILGGSTVTADVTLATLKDFPTDPLLDQCDTFIAGLGL